LLTAVPSFPKAPGSAASAMPLAGPPSSIRPWMRLEKSSTARSWRRFQAKSATTPTAKIAAVTNQIAREDKINLRPQ
jgi:hypothetical protein